MSRALKSNNSVESDTSDKIVNALESRLAEAIHANVIKLELFDANKHSAKYYVTLPNGKQEIGEEYADLEDIAEQVFGRKLLDQWASEAFEDMPTQDSINDYVSDNSETFLTDMKCKVELK
jgi:hypothetical protein